MAHCGGFAAEFPELCDVWEPFPGVQRRWADGSKVNRKNQWLGELYKCVAAGGLVHFQAIMKFG